MAVDRTLIETRIIHLVARVAARIQPPLRARRIVQAVARLAPPLDAREAARAMAGIAGGSCFTRALTIAARLPGSTIVIAWQPGASGADPAAHAWVEHGGQVFGERLEFAGQEVARW